MSTIEQALAFFRESGLGTLTTLRPDGSPHMSVVFAVPVEGHLWISSTQDRVKTRNIRHDPRVAFAAGGRPWMAIEGMATIREGEGVLDLLRTYYRTARGEHEDWNEYDDAMIRERRLVIDVDPARAYGIET